MTNTTAQEAPKHSTIPLTLTPDSSKIHGYGYEPGTQTLAVRFKGFSDGKPGLFTYHYSNVTQEMVSALEAAESKGAHVNAVFVKTKYPFDKLLAEAPAAPADPTAQV